MKWSLTPTRHSLGHSGECRYKRQHTSSISNACTLHYLNRRTYLQYIGGRRELLSYCVIFIRGLLFWGSELAQTMCTICVNILTDERIKKLHHCEQDEAGSAERRSHHVLPVTQQTSKMSHRTQLTLPTTTLHALVFSTATRVNGDALMTGHL